KPDPASQEVWAPQPFLKPYPDPATVFADPVDRHVQHMHPLISVDLSAAHSDLSGWAHIVSPLEPCDGVVGDSGREHWSPYLQPNWIGFKVTDDGRYQLLGDFRFFGTENVEGTESYPGARKELEEFYVAQEASFAAHREVFLQTGKTCSDIRPNRKPREIAALSQLGGRAPVGNIIWADVGSPAFLCSDVDDAPITLDGRQYRFIASARGWNYRDSGADNILLFYDPVERIALQTFVWT
ncbi:MAG: hypothetical protein AAF441_18340, partial [Pseudomonadota bacterium]